MTLIIKLISFHKKILIVLMQTIVCGSSFMAFPFIHQKTMLGLKDVEYAKELPAHSCFIGITRFGDNLVQIYKKEEPLVNRKKMDVSDRRVNPLYEQKRKEFYHYRRMFLDLDVYSTWRHPFLWVRKKIVQSKLVRMQHELAIIPETIASQPLVM